MTTPEPIAPALSSGFSTFAIDAGAIGGRVVVDGEDISAKLSAVQLVMGSKEPTVLTLELREGASGTIGGVALVDIVAAPSDMLGQFASLLESLSPEEVENAALNDPDLLSEPYAVTAAVLRHVARLVRDGRA